MSDFVDLALMGLGVVADTLAPPGSGVVLLSVAMALAILFQEAGGQGPGVMATTN